MAAQSKLTAGRETRLLAVLGLGESLEAACRCVGVSSTAVRKRAHHDPAFAERLRAARAGAPDAVVTSQALDWRVIAERLEHQDPLHWGPPPDEFDGAA